MITSSIKSTLPLSGIKDALQEWNILVINYRNIWFLYSCVLHFKKIKVDYLWLFDENDV